MPYSTYAYKALESFIKTTGEKLTKEEEQLFLVGFEVGVIAQRKLNLPIS